MRETSKPVPNDSNYPEGNLFREDKDWGTVSALPETETDETEPIPATDPKSKISFPEFSLANDNQPSKPLTDEQLNDLTEDQRKLFDKIGYPGTKQYDEFERRRFLWVLF